MGFSRLCGPPRLGRRNQRDNLAVDGLLLSSYPKHPITIEDGRDQVHSGHHRSNTQVDRLAKHHDQSRDTLNIVNATDQSCGSMDHGKSCGTSRMERMHTDT